MLTHLLNLGVPQTRLQDIDYLQWFLRMKMVEEWRTNQDKYQGYIVDDLTTLGPQYQLSGQFSGDVGDLMLMTLSNVLSMPITLFTSVPNMPTLCIIPTHHTSLSAQPLFLAYTQSGPGHYDSVVPVNDDRECAQDKKCKCYCGQKSDGISEKCLSFRCTCHRQSRGCHNKYGIRPLPPTTRKLKKYV